MNLLLQTILKLTGAEFYKNDILHHLLLICIVMFEEIPKNLFAYRILVHYFEIAIMYRLL